MQFLHNCLIIGACMQFLDQDDVDSLALVAVAGMNYKNAFVYILFDHFNCDFTLSCQMKIFILKKGPGRIDRMRKGKCSLYTDNFSAQLLCFGFV